VACVVKRRGAYRVLVGKTERKSPLPRLRHRWSDYIRMDLQKVICGGMHWIDLAQDIDIWGALVNGVISLLVHKLPGIS